LGVTPDGDQNRHRDALEEIVLSVDSRPEISIETADEESASAVIDPDVWTRPRVHHDRLNQLRQEKLAPLHPLGGTRQYSNVLDFNV
jgi:hypothetical protein